MNNITLDDAVTRYEAAIAALESADEKLSAEQILEVLIARDAVQAEIADKTRPNPGYLIRKVNELDLRLRKQTKFINQAIKLTDWRAILNPQERDWWWFLEPPTHRQKLFDWLWSALTIPCLLLATYIASCILEFGPGTLGPFAGSL